MAEDFSLMIKTYRRDLKMATRLLKSIEEFNVDSLPIFLVCPSRDLEVFQQFASSANLRIVPEESIETRLFSESDPESKTSGVGYMNQQIFKLAFSTLGLSERYLCLDSDVLFLRKFTKWDFINEPANLPYLFQSEDRELSAERSYVSSWVPRKVALRKIEATLQAPEGELFFSVHGFQVFASDEIDAMMSWLETNATIMDFKEMLAVSGYEFNWYTTWVRTHSNQFISREPIFKTFHSSREFARALFFGLSEADYARGYVGVCVNGNFQHGRGHHSPLSLSSNSALVGGVYLSFFDNARLVLKSIGALMVSAAIALPRLLRRLILLLKRR